MHCLKEDSVLGREGFSVRAASPAASDPATLDWAMGLESYELPRDMKSGQLLANQAPRRLACPLGGSDPPDPPCVWGDPSPTCCGPAAQARGSYPAPIAHIAPDPMEAAFDDGDFAARLTRRHTGVKRALLDQSLISGVGNIYADEALWRARLHWARPTETLKRGEVARLLGAVREVLSEALRAGGTTVRWAVPSGPRCAG